mmetsp:Transcript_3788/g.13646  ORF Transcript_3788/g.13646 Transcript_3788/m.13646 type:complete len:99 (-) Transcript_3788:232-528(-)
MRVALKKSRRKLAQQGLLSSLDALLLTWPGRYRVKWLVLIPMMPQDLSISLEYYYGKHIWPICLISDSRNAGLFFHLPFVFIITVCVVFTIRWIGPGQ